MPDRATSGMPLRLRLLCVAVACLGAGAGLVRACWRGELPLWLATFVLAAACNLVNPVWKVVDGVVPPGPSGLFELLVLTGWAACLWLTLAWAGVGFWRSLRANQDAGGSAVIAIGALLLIAPTGMSSWSSARQMSCYAGSLWRESLASRDPGSWSSRAFLTFDDRTRTLWVRGAIELGTAMEFSKALQDHPSTRTIGLQSPGGYVGEAKAMAAEILRRRLDTYAPLTCASACVDLFAAGQNRWTAPQAVFGLHRSGHECREDQGLNRADLEAANFLRERDVAEEFVQRAFQTPYRSVWMPDVRTVLESGLATGLRETETAAHSMAAP